MEVLTRNPQRVHVDPTLRDAVGRRIALEVERIFREQAPPNTEDLLLCPGCTMIAVFDAFLELARTQQFSLQTCASQLGSVLQDCASTANVNVAALAERLR